MWELSTWLQTELILILPVAMLTIPHVVVVDQ